MRGRAKPALLIFAHLLLFNGLFVLRASPRQANAERAEFKAGAFEGSAVDYLRLYYSHLSDEAYYYEWSSAVFGQALEPTYPPLGWVPSGGGPRVPYRDIAWEYPPLLIAPVLLARACSWDYLSFTRALAFILSLVYLAALSFAFRIWRQLDTAERLPWNAVLGLSLLGMAALGQLYATRLDAVPALTTAAALAAFLERHREPERAGRRSVHWAALWIAIGGLAKGYPLLLAPLFALILWRERRRSEIVSGAAVVVGVWAAVSLALAALTDGAYWDSFRFHSGRGIQIESLYALGPYVSGWLFDGDVLIYRMHGSLNIWAPRVASLVWIGTLAPAVVAMAIYVASWRESVRAATARVPAAAITRATVLLVFGAMIAFKVLSPQFIIWLSPLIYLTRPPRPLLFFALWGASLLITQVLYPSFYHWLEFAHWQGIVLLGVRNLALVVLFAWLWRTRGARTSKSGGWGWSRV